MKRIILTLMLALFTLPILNAQDLPVYVPTEGLVAYYPFNGNANDASGNGHHGTVNGATLSSDLSGVNSAYSFTSSQANLSVSNNNILNLSDTDFTISVWAKLDATPLSESNEDFNQYYTILGKRQYAKMRSNYSVGISTPNSNIGGLRVTFAQGPRGVGSFIYSDQPIQATENWINIILVYTLNDNTIKFFVNANLLYQEDGVVVNSESVNDADLWFGSDVSGYADDFPGKIDDIGFWNRALTEQEIQNLYNSSTGDILLNGVVSAENNQIKNVADPTDAQDAVTMAYLQTKLDELSNRVKYLEDNAPNNQPSGTWTKVFDLENLPQNFDFTSMQKVTQYSYNKSNKEVYFLNRNNNSLFVYDIDMNSFNEINVDYQISSGGDYIYNPQKNTIEYLRAGRETVYEIDLSSYGSSLVKTSGSDTSHYGASMFYNPFTSEIGQIFGYGWYRVKNSMANLNLENGWEVSIADSDSSPQRRTGAHVFPTKDYKKIIVLGGYGNQSGSQTEDSCSNPNTSPWATDVGVWCFQSDIWEIDLADYSASQISDFNIGMKKSSVMSYNYDKNIIINYAGILPPATYSSSYSQEVANWDFSLLFFDINNPNLGWQEQSQSGDLPSETLEKGYFIYDESSSLFYYFRNDGVWTLSM